jgi:hypothetical protein
LQRLGPHSTGYEPSPANATTEVALASLKATKKRELAGGENVTAYEDITHYNNYYEFGTGKEDPARNAGRLRTQPWSLLVDGECEAPGRVDLEDLIRPQALEERIYRHRCVEAWSMVAPWTGVPLDWPSWPPARSWLTTPPSWSIYALPDTAGAWHRTQGVADRGCTSPHDASAAAME